MTVLPPSTPQGGSEPTLSLPPLRTLLWATTALLLLIHVLQTLRTAYLTPLRRVPGPWYAPLTHLPLKYATLRGRRLHHIHALHGRYGPLVRVAPTELAAAAPADFRAVHRVGGGFVKAEWYGRFRNSAIDDVFSLRDARAHAARRRMLARAFGKGALRAAWEGVVRRRVERAVGRVREEAVREGGVGGADVYKWWTLMTADVIGQVAFGCDFGLVELGKYTPEMEDFELAAAVGAFRAEFTWLHDFLQWLRLPGLRYFAEASERFMNYANVAVANARAGNIGTSNIFNAVLAEHEKDAAAMDDMTIKCEAVGLIAAGSGTTAVTLTYLVWAVLSRPDLQKRLEDEVGALEELSDVQLEELPLLNAIIDESLRVYGAAPGSLPRVVPEGGATLSGYYVPAGTTVSTQAYSIHRDEEVFPDAEKFDPDRFLTDPVLAERQRAVMNPFGGGARTCLGVHLARMELRHAAAFFFRECRGATLAAETTEESMEITHHFLIAPAARKCNVCIKA